MEDVDCSSVELWARSSRGSCGDGFGSVEVRETGMHIFVGLAHKNIFVTEGDMKWIYSGWHGRSAAGLTPVRQQSSVGYRNGYMPIRLPTVVPKHLSLR